MMERLHRLAAVFGPSGREEKVAAVLRELIEPHVDEVGIDRLGNLVAVRKGRPGGKRVMLSANMDSVGALALKISEKGMIGLAPVGNLKVQSAIGQRVVWSSGAVGILQHEPAEPKDLDFRKLWCDVGASSRAEAEAAVRMGDLCAFVGELQELGDMVAGPNLDNRAGCAVLLEVAGDLTDCEHEVVFTFTCQGAVGHRGAAAAAFGAEPDLSLVLDASSAGDVPGGPKTEVRLGGGPVLRLKDAGFMPHALLSQEVQSVAAEHSIPLQTEILTAAAGVHTDATGISLARTGVPTAIIGVPTRYRGTAAEMVNRRDLYGAADLVRKLLQKPLGV